jgi:hypothetical protein
MQRILGALFFLGTATQANLTFDPADDIDRDWTEIVTENGFAFEKHAVTTDDGYILGLYRIPGKTGGAVGKAPVFL